MSEQNIANVLVLKDLPKSKPRRFEVLPDAGARDALAQELGLVGIKKLRFKGELVPHGTKGWALKAELGATIVQNCVVTLEPVTTRIDDPVARTYRVDYDMPDTSEETEMPEDDSIEPMPATIDLDAILAEALALGLPEFPRAASADYSDTIYAPPGADPLTEQAIKPFAGLASLKEKLENPN